MNIPRFNFEFPKQKVSAMEKDKPDWYANSIDYIIALGESINDRSETETKLNILHGNIPESFYKKTLNPYNAKKEKYKRFPAMMRNYDIMNDIIRRYVGEYYKGSHQFVVGANNPDIVLNHNLALKKKVVEEAEKLFRQQLEQNLQKLQQEAAANGQSVESVNPQDAMPDPEEFLNKFEEDYIDKESKQGQDVLNYIRDMTDDMMIYLTAFFNYCSLGECYSYTEIRNNKIIKECVPVTEAYPIPNNQYFIEDHDMFARKMALSYNQILDMFDEYLDDKDRQFLEDYYYNGAVNKTNLKSLDWEQFFNRYTNVCDKFNNEERTFFKTHDLTPSKANTNLYEVWHVTWKGFAKQGILRFVNEVGFEDERIVDESYEFNPQNGDIDIQWIYTPQVYEGYRIGTRYTGIYPIKARPILFGRHNKLPYNGIQEVLPYMGQFSIVEIITPFQVLRNIITYHQEMTMAKNKMLILLLPKSLLGTSEDEIEDSIYKMAADGTFLADDEEDPSGTRLSNVRLLNASLNGYINDLENFKAQLKNDARELVDMNAQRYGQIAQSAGAATTQSAVAQSSTGSLIIFQTFDEFRKRDYNRDLDYGKLAFVEGLETSYVDKTTGKKHYISLDVNSYVSSDYSTTVRNNGKELDKINQLKQWAFSAAQNGDLESALAAIEGDNIAVISAEIKKFAELKRQHEESIKQTEQMIQQEANQIELQKIQAKGEEDRKTIAFKSQYDLQLAYAKGDMDMLSDMNPGNDDYAKNDLARITAATKEKLEASKLQLERQKMAMDAYDHAADRQVKREEMANELKIAKTNKNRYDK